MTMTQAELERVHSSRQSLAIEAALAGVLLRSINKGEINGVTLLIERMFGKVPLTSQNVNVNASYADAIKAAQSIPLPQLSERLRLAREGGEID
jgi:hypothetical protein